MDKYYTKPCNFYFGKQSEKKVKNKESLPIGGNRSISFDTIEIVSRKNKKLINIKKISKLSKRQLSSCGLSRQKIEYIKIITKKFIDKSISVQKLKKLSDEDAIKYLTTIKGVGKWTAEMFLFFNQLRPNIFPVQDIGLLRAISIHYKTKYPPNSSQLNYFRNKWSPYCTVATWYLWRSIDPVPVKY